jgi:outer membrane protein, heavy metal efflux system
MKSIIHMKWFKLFFSFLGLSLYSLSAPAQMLLSEEDAVKQALENSPMLKVAELQVTQQQQLQKAAFNLANPDFTLESPTGEFMTVGVMQSFAFPTVYARQGQLAREQTALAEQGKVITATEVQHDVRTAYLNLQYARTRVAQLQEIDSVLLQLSEIAARQFEAGEVNALEKLYAATQYSKMHIELIGTIEDESNMEQLLQFFTGVLEERNLAPLEKKTGMDFSDQHHTADMPIMKYYDQMQEVAEASLKLEKNRVLPGFAIGYLNQSLPGTPVPLRIRAGISIPLWFWQYSASIKAARTAKDISQQTIQVQQKTALMKLYQVSADMNKFGQALEYFDETALGELDQMIEVSLRMFKAGEADYLVYLRTLIEALEMKLNYLETIRNYNQSVIEYNYLKGK